MKDYVKDINDYVYDYSHDPYEFEYEEDEMTSETEYEVFSKKLDNRYLTVEFSYDEATPLQHVMDEVSDYIEDRDLEYAWIHSMHTELDRDGENFLIVTFLV